MHPEVSLFIFILDPPKKLQVNKDTTLEEFLLYIPNPEKQFSDEGKQVSEAYKTNSKIFLMKNFKRLRASYINSILEKHHSHLLPAYKELAQHLPVPKGIVLILLLSIKNTLIIYTRLYYILYEIMSKNVLQINKNNELF